jgi:hypothetical protein
MSNRTSLLHTSNVLRPNLRYYHAICLELLRKTTHSQDSLSPGRETNWKPQKRQRLSQLNVTVCKERNTVSGLNCEEKLIHNCTMPEAHLKSLLGLWTQRH